MIFHITKIKIMMWFSSTLLLIGFWAVTTSAASFDTYGNLDLQLAYKDQNDNFITANKAFNPSSITNLWSYDTGDIFVHGSDEQTQIQFLLDYKFEGNLQDNTSTVFYPNQYYVTVPFGETSFLYCGKKYKKVGVAQFFNVNNRYNWPGGYPSTLLEYDVLQSDVFNYGFVADFKNSQKWDQIQLSAFTDYCYKNFDLQGYFFDENADNRYCLGMSMSYQAGSIQYYGEAIFLSKADQEIVIGNTGNLYDDFKFKDLNDTTKITAGIMVNQKNYSITVEYSRNNQGYEPNEQDDLVNYLLTPYDPTKSKVKLTDRKTFVDDFAYLWSKNYLGLKFFLPALVSNDCSLTTSLIASLPDEGLSKDYASYASYESSIQLAYNIKQNLTFRITTTYRCGGSKGEFLNLNEEKMICLSELFYSF